MEFAPEFNMKPTSQLEKIVAHAIGAIIYDLDNQRLRIFHCTAHAAPRPTQTVGNAALCQLSFTPFQAP